MTWSIFATYFAMYAIACRGSYRTGVWRFTTPYQWKSPCHTSSSGAIKPGMSPYMRAIMPRAYAWMRVAYMCAKIRRCSSCGSSGSG